MPTRGQIESHIAVVRANYDLVMRNSDPALYFDPQWADVSVLLGEIDRLTETLRDIRRYMGGNVHPIDKCVHAIVEVNVAIGQEVEVGDG